MDEQRKQEILRKIAEMQAAKTPEQLEAERKAIERYQDEMAKVPQMFMGSIPRETVAEIGEQGQEILGPIVEDQYENYELTGKVHETNDEDFDNAKKSTRLFNILKNRK